MSHQDVQSFTLTGNNRRAMTQPTGRFPVHWSHLTPPAGYHIGEIQRHTMHGEVVAEVVRLPSYKSVRRAYLNSGTMTGFHSWNPWRLHGDQLFTAGLSRFVIKRLKPTHQVRSTWLSGSIADKTRMAERFNWQCTNGRRPPRAPSIPLYATAPCGRLHASLFNIETIKHYAASVERADCYHSAVVW